MTCGVSASWALIDAALAVLDRMIVLAAFCPAQTTVATPAGPTSTCGSVSVQVGLSETLRAAPQGCPVGCTATWTSPAATHTTAATPVGPTETSGSVALTPAGLTVTAGVHVEEPAAPAGHLDLAAGHPGGGRVAPRVAGHHDRGSGGGQRRHVGQSPRGRRRGRHEHQAGDERADGRGDLEGPVHERSFRGGVTS